MHEFLNAHRGLVDSAAAALFGLAAVNSILQTLAWGVTILSGLGSLSLVYLRWHRELKGKPSDE